MLGLCSFLANHLNGLIHALAVIEAGILVYTGLQMFWRKREIEALNRPQIRKTGASKPAPGQTVGVYETRLDKKWYEEYNPFLERYQRSSSWYRAFSLIIQLFTLLGILGTVAGLYIAMNEGRDIYQGVEFALSSTVLGIIYAVVFKVLDIVLSAWLINAVEENIERFEKSYQVETDDARHEGAAP